MFLRVIQVWIISNRICVTYAAKHLEQKAIWNRTQRLIQLSLGQGHFRVTFVLIRGNFMFHWKLWLCFVDFFFQLSMPVCHFTFNAHLIFLFFFRFSTKSRLNRHMNTHNRETIFYCDLCDFQTFTKNSLTNHKKLHGEKRFECEFCGKKFAVNKTLQVLYALFALCTLLPLLLSMHSIFIFSIWFQDHRNIHTGKKPYPCRFCDYGSTCRSNTNKHMKTVHKNEFKPIQMRWFGS